MQTVPLIEGFTDIRNMATLFTFLAFGVLGFFAISDRKQVNQQVLLVSDQFIEAKFVLVRTYIPLYDSPLNIATYLTGKIYFSL